MPGELKCPVDRLPVFEADVHKAINRERLAAEVPPPVDSTPPLDPMHPMNSTVRLNRYLTFYRLNHSERLTDEDLEGLWQIQHALTHYLDDLTPSTEDSSHYWMNSGLWGRYNRVLDFLGDMERQRGININTQLFPPTFADFIFDGQEEIRDPGQLRRHEPTNTTTDETNPTIHPQADSASPADNAMSADEDEELEVEAVDHVGETDHVSGIQWERALRRYRSQHWIQDQASHEAATEDAPEIENGSQTSRVVDDIEADIPMLSPTFEVADSLENDNPMRPTPVEDFDSYFVTPAEAVENFTRRATRIIGILNQHRDRLSTLMNNSLDQLSQGIIRITNSVTSRINDMEDGEISITILDICRPLNRLASDLRSILRWSTDEGILWPEGTSWFPQYVLRNPEQSDQLPKAVLDALYEVRADAWQFLTPQPTAAAGDVPEPRVVTDYDEDIRNYPISEQEIISNFMSPRTAVGELIRNIELLAPLYRHLSGTFRERICDLSLTLRRLREGLKQQRRNHA